jgi:hypothetical protein
VRESQVSQIRECIEQHMKKKNRKEYIDRIISDRIKKNIFWYVHQMEKEVWEDL